MGDSELEITVPSVGKDKSFSTQPETINNHSQDVTSSVNLVNQYLWFGLGVVSMVVIVIAGIKLITAHGDEKEMKKVNQLIIGLITGVVMAMLSYLLVRVVSNAF